jgi:hypothetical protein
VSGADHLWRGTRCVFELATPSVPRPDSHIHTFTRVELRAYQRPNTPEDVRLYTYFILLMGGAVVYVVGGEI